MSAKGRPNTRASRKRQLETENQIEKMSRLNFMVDLDDPDITVNDEMAEIRDIVNDPSSENLMSNIDRMLAEIRADTLSDATDALSESSNSQSSINIASDQNSTNSDSAVSTHSSSSADTMIMDILPLNGVASNYRNRQDNSVVIIEDDDDLIFVSQTSPNIPTIDLIDSPLLRRNVQENRADRRRASASISAATPTSTAPSAANISMNEVGKPICPICMDEVQKNSPQSTICGHIFCFVCISTALRTSKKCPLCNKKLSAKGYHPIYLS